MPPKRGKGTTTSKVKKFPETLIRQRLAEIAHTITILQAEQARAGPSSHKWYQLEGMIIKLRKDGFVLVKRLEDNGYRV